MDLMPTEEQEQIVDAARAMLSKELTVDHVRWEPDPAGAKDRGMLKTFAELGWFGLGLPEEAGGVGFGATEEMLLFREVGRYLVTPMLLAGVVGARLATLEGASEVASGIIAGSITVGLAISRVDEGYYLIDADQAGLVLVVEGDRLALFPRDGFFDVMAARCIDGSVTFATAGLGSAVVGVNADDAHVSELRDHLSLLIASMLVGGAEAVRDLTVAHASERSQFGQKIGTFQAVSHPLADMAVRCEAALSQTKFASVLVRDQSGSARFHVAAARIVAINAALTNATASVQLHGGMGFAAEYPVHLFLKRAHLLDQIGGAMSEQLEQLFEQGAQ